MIILLGESASGKSTIEKILVEKFGYKKLVSYTTRQPRTGEVDGVDYHFVDDAWFEEKIQAGYFAEHAEYNGWKYGVSIDDCLDGNIVWVATPHGLRQVRKRLGSGNVKSFYIKVDRRDRLMKLLQRGDNIEEAYRRSLSDVGQFDGIEDEVDYVLDNSGYYCSPEWMALRVLSKVNYGSETEVVRAAGEAFHRGLMSGFQNKNFLEISDEACKNIYDRFDLKDWYLKHRDELDDENDGIGVVLHDLVPEKNCIKTEIEEGLNVNYQPLLESIGNDTSTDFRTLVLGEFIPEIEDVDLLGTEWHSLSEQHKRFEESGKWINSKVLRERMEKGGYTIGSEKLTELMYRKFCKLYSGEYGIVRGYYQSDDVEYQLHIYTDRDYMIIFNFSDNGYFVG